MAALGEATVPGGCALNRPVHLTSLSLIHQHEVPSPAWASLFPSAAQTPAKHCSFGATRKPLSAMLGHIPNTIPNHHVHWHIGNEQRFLHRTCIYIIIVSYDRDPSPLDLLHSEEHIALAIGSSFVYRNKLGTCYPYVPKRTFFSSSSSPNTSHLQT